MKKVVSGLALAVVAAVALGMGLLAGGQLGYQAFVIRTGSMNPSIPPKSLVLVRTGEFAVGQVVSFRKGESIVSHRIVAKNPNGSFTTRGDANRADDVSPVRADEIIGGVVAHVDTLGFWVVYLRNPLTLASLAMLGVFLWAIWPFFFGSQAPTATGRQQLRAA